MLVCKRYLLFLLCAGLTFSAGAQKSKTAPTKKAPVKKEAPKKAVSSEDEPPPQVEELEETKIDVVRNPEPPPQINFDTTAAPDDALTAAIVKLLTLTGALEADTEMAEESIRESLKHTQLPIKEEFIRRFVLELKEGRGKRWLQNLYIRTYRSLYTEEDIRGMIAFYGTPLGQKVSRNMKQQVRLILQNSTKIGEYLGVSVMQEIMAENNK